MKKIIAGFLFLSVLFAGFANGQGDSGSAGAAGTSAGPLGKVPAGVELAADGRYPAKTIKLGFVNYDTTAEQVLAIQQYFKYLEKAFNVEIMWSESIDSAEKEFSFIQLAAASGCKGIIGYYNEGKAESVKLAASLGMYYWGGAEDSAIYDPVKDSKYYLGGFDTGKTSYDFGFAIAKALADAGSRRIIVMSGGKDFGVPSFVQRYNGVMDGIKAEQAKGVDMKVVYEVPGWPGTEAFGAHVTAALQTDADGLAGTLTALMWLQPIQNAGKMGKIKIAAIESVTPDMVGLMKSGVYVGVCSEVTGLFGLSFPMMINAIEGYGDQQRNADGTAAKVKAKNWIFTNADDMAYFASIEKTGGSWTFDIEDLKSIMGAFNPKFTVSDMSALYSAVSADEVKARKAKR